MPPTELAAALAIVSLAGFARGVTGFGGAMVMTPPLSLLVGPTQAVATALLLEIVPAAYLLPGAFREMSGRIIGPICVAACATVPLGGYLLVTVDPAVMRRFIAGMVVLFAIGMLVGVRYAGPQRLSTSIGLGAVSGVLLGATSMGAPPVIVYLLSGPDPAPRTRANLIIYITVISVAGLLVLWLNGVFTTPLLSYTAAMAPFFFGALWAGSAVFRRIREQTFRRVTLIFLIVVSLSIMFA
jgi:uncharacterized membrane protein YfcA